MTLDEMWERLAQYQSYADKRGYGSEWARMCEERTQDAAWEALQATEVSVALQAVGMACEALRAAEEVEELATNAIEWIEDALVDEKAEGKN
jgi:hypothetical protein